MEITDTMTLVAIVMAIVAFPMFGGGFARGDQLERDPKYAERAAIELTNPVRGCLVIGSAVIWAAAGMLIYKLST